MKKYDPDQWRSHLFDIRGSLVREICFRVAASVAWSVVVVILSRQQAWLHFNLNISPLPHTLIGAALSLLLVFRTNSSYDRFWEGRKLWGAIVNDSRNLARSVTVLLAADMRVAREIVQWNVALVWAAANQLQGVERGPTTIEGLPHDELAAMASSRQPWLQAARQITRRLRTAQSGGLITDIQYMYLDQNVQRLVDWIGGCQRIHNTPLPYAYMVHLRRALIVYVYTLPFVLVDMFAGWTVLVTLLLNYTLFGIEEIGVEIEDPFGHDENDLPLSQFCDTIERDLREMVETAGNADNRR